VIFGGSGVRPLPHGLLPIRTVADFLLKFRPPEDTARVGQAGPKSAPGPPVTQLPYILTSAAFGVLATAVTVRIVHWSRLPAHLRWELYPIPHQPPEKARYGGSFMEDTDWWTRPRQTSRLGEAKSVIREILLLSSVRDHNRRLWLRTFPFHSGLYLVTVAIILALGSGVLRMLATPGHDSHFLEPMRMCVLWLGVAGLSLGALGATALLYHRLTDPGLRRCTVPADIFNLAFFVIAFALGLLTWGLTDPGAHRALAFAAHLVAFEWDVPIGYGFDATLATASIAVAGLLLAYIPLTHMSHFVGKYFAYHAIRWNDTPNLAGGPEESRIERLLAYRVSWAAGHIRSKGASTWAELASSDPTESKS